MMKFVMLLELACQMNLTLYVARSIFSKEKQLQDFIHKKRVPCMFLDIYVPIYCKLDFKLDIVTDITELHILILVLLLYITEGHSYAKMSVFLSTISPDISQLIWMIFG